MIMAQKKFTFDYNVIFYAKNLINIYIVGCIWYQNLNFT
jgi:hypothetical protein